MIIELHVMLARVISVFLALIFLAAAWHKLQHSLEFSGVVRNFKILPEWAVPAVSSLLPVVELITGLGLFAGYMLSLMTTIAFILLAVFAVAIAINLLRGRSEIDCGCFRPESRQHLSWFMVLRNIVLAFAALYSSGVHALYENATSLLIIYPAAVGFAVLYFTTATVSSLVNSVKQQGSH